MRLLPLLAASIVFVTQAAFADVPAYTLNKEKSFIKFYAIQNNAPVEGRFTDFTTDIHFDPDHLDKSSIKAEVMTGSVQVSNDDILKYLRMPDWLGVEAFPKATFRSKKISRMPSTDGYYVEGEITLRGKKLPVMLNFQLEQPDDKNAIAKGYITLHRRDFKIGQGEWAKDDVVKDEVRVELRISATKQ